MFNFFHKIGESVLLRKNNISLVIQKNYTIIFKGGIALLGIFLLGVSQCAPILLEHGYEAKRLQYKVEALTSSSLESIDCEKIQYTEDCKLAKYKISSVSSMAKLATILILSCYYIGIILVMVSFWGFWRSLNVRNPT